MNLFCMNLRLFCGFTAIRLNYLNLLAGDIIANEARQRGVSMCSGGGNETHLMAGKFKQIH